MSSLIPKGFHITAHEIFKNYQPPIILKQTISNNTISVTNNDNSSTVNSTFNDNIEIDSNSSTICKSDIEPDSEECAICLCNFDEPVTLIKCHHNFCFICISHWCEKTNTCPLCKSTLTDFIKYNKNCMNINANISNNCDNIDSNKFHIWRFVEDTLLDSKEIEYSRNKSYNNKFIQSAIKYHNNKFQLHTINEDISINNNTTATTPISNNDERKDIKKKQKII